jgi:diguanylate cyclase (GGDEF)-like protein
LTRDNYQLISSTNSYEALDKIENEIIPDLVLIDSNMPDLNGFELTKIIRKRYSLFQLPIIIISNTSFEDERNLAFGAGANDIITKPYNSTELISRINTYITLNYSIQDNQKHLMLENELSMARKLQLKMLPHKKPFLNNIKIVTLYLPMTYLAGDFYDYYEDSNGLGVLIADVTDQRKSRELINRQANFDSLTGLLNRRSILSLIDRMIAQSIGGGNFVVLYVDLDNFKDINDSRGHDFGDELLVEIADRLKSVLGHSDGLARINSDEFVVLLANSDQLQSLDGMVEDIFKKVIIYLFILTQGEMNSPSCVS